MNFITHTLRNKCETNMAVIITQTHPLKKCEKNYEHHHTPPAQKCEKDMVLIITETPRQYR